MEYHEINHIKYWVNEYDAGFAWVSDHDEGPCFPTALEALQHAILNEQIIARNREADLAERLEDECFGTFREQVNATYNHFIRH